MLKPMTCATYTVFVGFHLHMFANSQQLLMLSDYVQLYIYIYIYTYIYIYIYVYIYIQKKKQRDRDRRIRKSQ